MKQEEINMLNRALYLMKVYIDLVDKYKSMERYSVDILDATIKYDGAECDTTCLRDDMEDIYLDILDYYEGE